MKIKFEWEKISDYTWRAKVIRGWLVSDYSGESISTVFIPDPKHEWEIDNDSE